VYPALQFLRNFATTAKVLDMPVINPGCMISSVPFEIRVIRMKHRGSVPVYNRKIKTLDTLVSHFEEIIIGVGSSFSL
jgi:hypothetical protein